MESYSKREYSVSGDFHSTLKFQMSALAAMMLARKVRVNLSDQSSLVLQTFGQLNEKPIPGQVQQETKYEIRRYSITPEQSEESVNNSEVCQTLSSPLTQPSLVLTNPGGQTADFNITPSDVGPCAPAASTVSATPASTHILTRMNSSPHLAVLPSLLGSPRKNSIEGSDFISQYIRRRQSHSGALTLVEYKPESDGTAVNKTIMPSSTLPPSDGQKLVDPNTTGTNTLGLGILSRTRQFGAWLTKATDGEKVDVSKKDLNALAPNSF